ncbi:SulP family inorganic anion transporter [Muriicola soli]|uniref:Solute carrier 26 family protein n=1 Tax=Muriicola soli TaxID=2507538 RepID=A0A411EBH6_9FLAO|nr:solute carrier family 26 protein [Muriicola soli]QBA64800.1 solute carrier 26 family protein [Muriicola soli]
MLNIFPFIGWLRTYKWSFLPKDFMAGLTVAIVLIPQGLAYALIAGLPAVYGLYASMVPLLIYTFFGTSRSLGVGPVAMDSLLVAAGLGAIASVGPENYIAMAVLLAFMVGFIQLFLGLLRMGFLVNFLSKPVISGFTSGAALIIMLSQLKYLLGTDIEGSSQLHNIIWNTILKAGEFNPYDLGIGLSGILLMIALRKWNKKLPYILLVVIIGIVSVYFFQWVDKGVDIVGEIPKGLPVAAIPDLSWKSMMPLWPIAFTLSLVGYLETISIGKGIEDKMNNDQLDANRELVALGLSNMTGSIFQSYPVTASFSRSAIYHEAKSKTNLATLITALIVLLTLLFLTPLFYYLPKAALAAIIMVSVYNLIDVKYALVLWKYRKDEFLVLLSTFAITLFVGIMEGILVGVLISLLLMVYRTSNPHLAVLANIKGTPYYRNIKRFGSDALVRKDLLIIRFDAQLYFGNSSFFKSRLLELIDGKGPELKAVILNAEAINYIDSSAAHMLRNLLEMLYQKGIQFYIAGAIGPTRDILFSSGIMELLPKECLFVETREAVLFFDDPAKKSQLQNKVALQRNTLGN